MAKTKTKARSRSKSVSKPDSVLHSTSAHVKSSKSHRPTENLLTEAASLLEQSQPELALPLAAEALRRLQQDREVERSEEDSIDEWLKLAAQGKATLPTTFAVNAEIHLALGDVDSARQCFAAAAQLDPNGALVSADPWLWLAQLCEEGGQKSIEYFEKGCEVLKNEIEVLRESLTQDGDDEGLTIIEERGSRLANALCGMAEVYMTDLSWELDAETKCEAYVTEAVAVCPERLSASPLQTLASVRISQERLDEAQEALKRSMSIWIDIPAEIENDARPDFATRVSLSRLLMEVEVEMEAFRVVEGLVRDDDQSVECNYLGGWCQVLLSQKPDVPEDERFANQTQAKVWLDNCLRLYRVQDYDDDRLRDHTLELKKELDSALGVEADDSAWEDEEDADNAEEDIEVEISGPNAPDDVEMT